MNVVLPPTQSVVDTTGCVVITGAVFTVKTAAFEVAVPHGAAPLTITRYFKVHLHSVSPVKVQFDD